MDRSLSEEATLSFGASRRVTPSRPRQPQPLRRLRVHAEPARGNPNLKPQFTQSYEAGYGYEGRGSSYGVTGYYRLNQDSVTGVTEYLGNGLSLTTKTNLPKDDSAGLEFSANGHIARTLTYGISGNLFYSQIDATALGMAGLQSTVGLNAKVKLDYRPDGRRFGADHGDPDRQAAHTAGLRERHQHRQPRLQTTVPAGPHRGDDAFGRL